MNRQDDDPFVSFPLKAPEPVPGCSGCDRLVCAEVLADKQADPSRATDERVRLRIHLEVEHGVANQFGQADGRVFPLEELL